MYIIEEIGVTYAYVCVIVIIHLVHCGKRGDLCKRKVYIYITM